MADLLPAGTIRWMESKQIFTTPSAWVNFCKRTMTGEQVNKTLSAWTSIKYRGKRLDSYKLRWYRRQKKSGGEQSPPPTTNANGQPLIPANGSLLANPAGGHLSGVSGMELSSNILLDGAVKSNTELLSSINPSLAALYNEASKSSFPFDEDPVLLKQRHVLEHDDLPKKFVFKESDIQPLHCDQLVRAVPFRSLDRIQPFTITVSTNALLLMDYHCHLTDGEVVGYLAGSWDIGTHMLCILQAFPCRARLGDETRAKCIEEEIQQNLRQRNLSLVGWYHSHADKPSQPSVKDIECQLEYQVTMKGNECDLAYIPCVGFICSPYDPFSRNRLSSFLAYWVMPPSEMNSFEYGKPMQMFYQISRDSFLTQDLLLEMVSFF